MKYTYNISIKATRVEITAQVSLNMPSRLGEPSRGLVKRAAVIMLKDFLDTLEDQPELIEMEEVHEENETQTNL